MAGAASGADGRAPHAEASVYATGTARRGSSCSSGPDLASPRSARRPWPTPRPPGQGRARPIRINLYSDTQTRPTPAMREAMKRAEVGDEQHGNDPTVHALCDRVAALLGKEAAMFLPSGTMCNVVAILTHCRSGEEVIAHETSHILTSEGGAHAAFTGVQILRSRARAGCSPPTTSAPPSARARAMRRRSGYSRWSRPPTSAAARCGRWRSSNAVAAVARGEGWSTHMDGARLMNACVASGIAAKDMAASFDSVWIDFTKGLGAPLGAVARRQRRLHRRGLALEAAPRRRPCARPASAPRRACYSLDHHVDRLAEDHRNAKALARGLRQMPGVAVEEPETNLVFFDPAGAGVAGARADRAAAACRACT